MNQEINEKALQIVKRFADKDIILDVTQVESDILNLTQEFHIPVNESIRTVIRKFAKQYDVDMSSASAAELKVGDLYSVPAGTWINVLVKISMIGAPHPKVKQKGIVGDDTGTASFIISNNTPDTPLLEEGRCYLFENVVTNTFNNQPQVSINRSSKVTECPDMDMEVKPFTKTAEGVIVDIQNGSGLIKRCPECKRALSKGMCMEHGKVAGVYDLRIKAIINDGKTDTSILFQRELTEAIIGIDMDMAVAMAADALDQSVVLDDVRKKIFGRYYSIEVSPAGNSNLVQSFQSKTGTLTNPTKA